MKNSNLVPLRFTFFSASRFSLFVVMLLASQCITYNAFGRYIKLEKTGGSGLIYSASSLPTSYSGIQPTFPSTSVMLIEEGTLNAIYNWTEEFMLINATVQNDVSENNLTTVSYKITIESDGSTNPMIVGRQQTNTSLFLQGDNMLYFDGQITGGMRNITVTSPIKAYIKYKDELYFGSWLPPQQTLYFWTFDYNFDQIIGPPYRKVTSNIYPSLGSVWNPNYVEPGTIVPDYYPNTSSTAVAKSIADINPPQGSIWMNVYGESIQANVRFFLAFINCQNILVENLNVNGNNNNCKWGGVYGDVGIQTYYTGISIGSSTMCDIENCEFNNFGTDGMIIEGTSSDIDLIDCHFDYNGRQGLSWTDGSDVTAFNCYFNNTGRAISGNNKPCASAPASGLDIESHDGSVLLDGIFDTCFFVNNLGHGVTNNVAPEKTNNVLFKDCTFAQPSGTGIFVYGEDIEFNSCNIFAHVYGGYDGTNANYGTKFYDCQFEDKEYGGVPFTSHPYDAPLLRLDYAKNLILEKCTLKVNTDQREMFKMEYVSGEQNWRTFKDCLFIYANGGAPTDIYQTVPYGSSIVKSTFFQGKNKIINTKNDPCSFHAWITHQCMLVGSDDFCNPSELEMEGQFELYNDDFDFKIGKKLNLIDDGYSRLVVKNKSVFKPSALSQISIGNKSSVILKSGGSLYCGGKYDIKGLFAAEPNSHIGLVAGHDIENTGSMFIHEQTNPLNQDVHPFWLNNLCSFGAFQNITHWINPDNPISTLCIQGDHSYILADPNNKFSSCSPLYTNISTNGPFTVMYNVVNATCNGGLGSLNVDIQGGQGPYEAILNLIPMGANFGNVNPLPAGTYTISITDGSGCTNNSNTFTFEITQPPALAWNTVNQTNVSCNGGNNGSVSTTTTGGTGTITTTITGNSFTNLTANNYTVTATDANNCSISTTITITQPQPLSITPAHYRVCNTGQTTANGGTGGYTYAINPTTATINSSTGAIVNFTANGMYTVTVTDANNCTATCTIEKVEDEFCNCTDAEDLVHNNATQLFYNASLGTSLTGATLLVHGVLTLTTNITLTDCTVYFTDANGSINTNGFNLTMNNTTMQTACTELWKGIHTTGNSVVTIQGNSILYDMLDGVVINNTATLHANNSKFYNNYMGVQLNNTPSTYTGTITNCEFKTTATNLKGPYSTYSRGKHGIKINNCQQITIGGTAANKNHFENLYNGVYIHNNLISSIGHTTKTNYNTFKNISGGMSLLDNTLDVAMTYLGCAIYATNAFAVNDMTLQHIGNNNAALLDFEDCQRGIYAVGLSTDIRNNYTEETEGTFMSYVTGQLNTIRDNHIKNTYLGILISGTSWGGISNNDITHIKAVPVNAQMPQVYWGKGIYWNEYVAPNSGGLMIKDNTIQSNTSDYVLGMSIHNAKYAHIINNTIGFTSTSTTPNIDAQPSLIGLAINRSSGLDIDKNTITGTNNSTTEDVRKTCGIQLNASPNNYLHCNVNDYLQQGITIIGNCMTTNQLNAGLEQNRVTTTRFGWLLRHLGNQGTLGNVGIEAGLLDAFDANNKFGNALMVSNNKKVFKLFSSASQCTANTPITTIYTSPSNLQQSESTSNLVNNACAYVVETSNPGPAYWCTTPVNALSPLVLAGQIDIDQAEDIANEAVDYSEYNDMAQYFDERNLFGYLVEDVDMRNQYPVLNDFYMAQQGSTMQKLHTIDRYLGELQDSTTLHDVSTFNALLTTIQTLNNAISSEELYDINERQMNTHYITWLGQGVQQISQSNWEWIATLAHQCPYVAGNGVYKARMLYSQLNPLAHYNDLTICNSVGVFKNGKGLFDDEEAYLDSITQHSGSQLMFGLYAPRIKVFPNPSNDNVTIQYPYEGKFELMDMTGRKVVTIELLTDTKTVNFSVDHLPNGIYTYRYINGNVVRENGKFVKE